eukprot:CAMPEP_0114603756 /NCGR_PEP_ID=MMETSP0168-20121206/194_1 /TAXON_ID=95228 ORGANISM="Vannella sp., Strain DIVA3 517/6/12" /NCGR_SAMPLE_ID=MMETSP0168 /ASSEMBLY_ACC=CAM_ASM_000044 /LENGTH=102 /DNA_ID=CAMNT_0001814567 /DNA_START=1 /DNA_END=305 /DNA_ORIENTATION=+
MGPHVIVAGTTGVGEDGKAVAEGAYEQAVRALEIIEAALKEVDCDLSHVVRTRMYVVDIAAHSDDVGRAHGEVFRSIRPAATMVGVAALIDPSLKVEIEVEA